MVEVRGMRSGTAPARIVTAMLCKHATHSHAQLLSFVIPFIPQHNTCVSPCRPIGSGLWTAERSRGGDQPRGGGLLVSHIQPKYRNLSVKGSLQLSSGKDQLLTEVPT